jgi:NAD(P)-dependent dehydrogenase (short-subunit alcohol dehydrogenase family)
MSLLSRFKQNGPSGFGFGTTAEEVTEGLDLTGRNILLTGSNAGLGKETLRVLAMRGAHVIAAARTRDKAQRACDQVLGETSAVACELSDPGSVLACVAAVRHLGRPLDAIICNAGIMALPELKQSHGYELQFFTNHIGHFLLVTSLLGQLRETGRVVVVSSEAHRRCPPEGIQFDNLSGERGYSPFQAYGQSKLANVLFAKELAKRLEGTGKTANSLHPGVIATELSRNMNPVANIAMRLAAPLVLKSVPEGAATQCYVATHPQMEGVSGRYWGDCNEWRPNHHGRDESLAQRLWQASESIVAELCGSAAKA